MVCQSNLRILCPTYIDLYFLFYHLIHMDMQSLILTVYSLSSSSSPFFSLFNDLNYIFGAFKKVFGKMIAKRPTRSKLIFETIHMFAKSFIYFSSKYNFSISENRRHQQNYIYIDIHPCQYIGDDTYMTSMKIVQFSISSTPFVYLRPSYFHSVDLRRPISNEASPLSK